LKEVFYQFNLILLTSKKRKVLSVSFASLLFKIKSSSYFWGQRCKTFNLLDRNFCLALNTLAYFFGASVTNGNQLFSIDSRALPLLSNFYIPILIPIHCKLECLSLSVTSALV
jgi:hypothetical protein